MVRADCFSGLFGGFLDRDEADYIHVDFPRGRRPQNAFGLIQEYYTRKEKVNVTGAKHKNSLLRSLYHGAAGENRTLMTFRSRDFESRASTNSATAACTNDAKCSENHTKTQDA